MQGVEKLSTLGFLASKTVLETEDMSKFTFVNTSEQFDGAQVQCLAFYPDDSSNVYSESSTASLTLEGVGEVKTLQYIQHLHSVNWTVPFTSSDVNVSKLVYNIQVTLEGSSEVIFSQDKISNTSYEIRYDVFDPCQSYTFSVTPAAPGQYIGKKSYVNFFLQDGEHIKFCVMSVFHLSIHVTTF